MKTGLKLAIMLLLAGAAVAVLAVLFVNARERALTAHCRNNLRHLGRLFVNNWQEVDPELKGRAFWQEVRKAQWTNVRTGEWINYPSPDPFVCPVYGRTVSDPKSAQAIDYRGPRRVHEELRETPREEPVGADRPGNHPGGGGHVLRLDTSVGETGRIVPLLDAAGPNDPMWSAANQVLSD